MFRQSKSRSDFFRKTILPIRLSAIVFGGFWLAGLGTGGWLLQSAIAPPPVQAATDRLTITITRQLNETYQSMLRRAEAAARAAAQRSFDTDVLVTDIAVTAIGQNSGSITPMFTLEVNRQNWRTSPNPERWASYYTEAQSLLRLSPVTTVTTTTTPATSTPSPQSSPVNGNRITTDGAPTPRSSPNTLTNTPNTPSTITNNGNQPVPSTIINNGNQSVPSTTINNGNQPVIDGGITPNTAPNSPNMPSNRVPEEELVIF